MKKTLSLLLCTGMLLLAACGAQGGAGESAEASKAAPAAQEATTILLTEDGIDIHGGGARSEGGTVTIAAVGEYRISGTLAEGQIVVDTGVDAVNVTLILDGVSVTNPEGPALWVKQAKNLYLQLAPGSENLLISGREADLAGFDESRSGAAVYAEDDLIVEGAGNLHVLGYLNNGITCKDDLKVRGGSLEVLSANNGIRAAESIEISDGAISVRSGNDGLKTSSDKKADKGYIDISGGTISVSSGGDALAALTELRISGGTISTGSRRDLVSAASRKGLKAGTLVDISGGTLDIAADEDGIHSGDELRIRGGDVRVTASTGLQAGLRDSGAGDILLSGGKLFVSAAKQGLKAEGEIYANNELLVLFNSEKQAGFAEGGQSWFRAPVSGSAGDTVTVASAWDDVEVPQSFKILLCSSADFAPGDQITVSVSGHSYPITIR